MGTVNVLELDVVPSMWGLVSRVTARPSCEEQADETGEVSLDRVVVEVAATGDSSGSTSSMWGVASWSFWLSCLMAGAWKGVVDTVMLAWRCGLHCV